ncbi:achaete-scute complex protein T3-like [Condylostylus longicornis]|uniref:achaete-scute complex protein T3-like n=1 Tax=Condylostylus longicornis TaxID=2530218 RepID=UPI00244DE874|nr:achaete-scute complex protein T3-like [Condylostylus longicornis]
MASACIRPININNQHRSNNLNLSSLQNNQNFIIISQSNFNQITQEQNNTSVSPLPLATTATTVPVNSITSQKLKNLAVIAPAPTSSSSLSTITTTTTHSNSVLGMNSINIQSNQSNPTIMQQSNNCGIGGGNGNNNNSNIYKKKYTYANMPYGTELPPSVARRNARERNRVKQVNNGYANLRQHIPQTIINALTNGGRGASKKLSKVDTLRLAVEYIRRLQDVLLIDDNISEIGSDGGSLYSNNSNISGSSITDCETNSPQSTPYYHNADSPINNHHQQHHNNNINGSLSTLTTGTTTTLTNDNGYMSNHISYSDASVSPAPSYTSDISIGSNHNNQHNNNNNYLSQQSPNLENHNHNPHQQFKFEPYDNGYNSITDTTPEDEELLDYISSWQEQ